MAKTITPFFILSCIFLCTSFGRLTDKMPAAVANPYEGCCGTEPVVFSVGVGSVYIPNVVTPNNDGINDVFYPFINNRISMVENFTIQDATTDTIIFQKDSLILSDASLEAEILPDGWDGKVAGGQPHKGLFKYSMKVFDLFGASLDIQGSACSVLCDSAAVILQGNPSCFYPVQQNETGGVDASLPNFEEKCFSSN
jgi:hypothetical protein